MTGVEQHCEGEKQPVFWDSFYWDHVVVAFIYRVLFITHVYTHKLFR